MKPAKTIALLFLLLSPFLGGCAYTVFEVRHPTTESRVLSEAEQQYWTDRQSRQDKSREWNQELSRQSSTRLARYFR